MLRRLSSDEPMPMGTYLPQLAFALRKVREEESMSVFGQRWRIPRRSRPCRFTRYLASGRTRRILRFKMPNALLLFSMGEGMRCVR